MPLAFFFGRSFPSLLHLPPFPVLRLAPGLTVLWVLLRLSPSSGIIPFRASSSLPAGSRSLSLLPFIFPMSNFPLKGASALVLLLLLLRLLLNVCWSFLRFFFLCLPSFPFPLFLSPIFLSSPPSVPTVWLCLGVGFFV